MIFGKLYLILEPNSSYVFCCKILKKGNGFGYNYFVVRFYWFSFPFAPYKAIKGQTLDNEFLFCFL